MDDDLATPNVQAPRRLYVRGVRRSHKLILLRATEAEPKIDTLKYLEETFSKMPVSFYCLPGPNPFDFLLLGDIPDGMIRRDLTEARAKDNQQRFGASLPYQCVRHSYRTFQIHADQRDSDEIVVCERGEAEGATRESEIALERPTDRLFHAMMLFRYDYWHRDELVLGDLTVQLRDILEHSGDGASLHFCLSNLASQQGRRPRAHDRGATTLLNDQLEPFYLFNAMVRIQRQVPANELPSESLDWLHRVHHSFRMWLKDVAIAFPISPKQITSEMSSKAQICKQSICDIGRDVQPMFHLLFDGIEPDLRPFECSLPMGNFVVSATAKSGKTNPALAVLDAFSKWRGQLEASPDIDAFDIIYVNLKDWSDKATTLNATQVNEARIVKAFCEQKGLMCSCVLPEDLVSFFQANQNNSGALCAYTEVSVTDGKITPWQEILSGNSEKFQAGGLRCFRPRRGVLMVIDEILNTPIEQNAYRTHCGFYKYVQKIGRSVGVRMVLIGQELEDMDSTSFPISESEALSLRGILENSTLLICRQPDSDAYKRLVLEGVDEATATILECANLSKMSTIANARAKGGQQVTGPIIARPSLYGTNIHPIPCHIEPMIFTKAKLDSMDIRWWKPQTK